LEKQFIFIAGPCVIESEEGTLSIARTLRAMTEALPLEFIFKASFDKANRTSVDAYRGPGLKEGLRILQRVKDEVGVPVLSDIHETAQAEPAGKVLDIIQIPAFLCRQTDLLLAAGRTGKRVNIKKAQFMAPEDMEYAVRKVESTGNRSLLLTERGSCFGYHNLVVDFRSFSIMRQWGHPVIFDATHSVQTPSLGGKSGGRSEFVPPLCCAAAGYGIDGLFCEAHPNPPQALSDAANSLPLAQIPALLEKVLAIRAARGQA
jgi:2-dehydro-3-deoxyphosphooctonate aldolase (KDO 8-P synthase)